jgi:hypothetical protein
MPDIPVFHKDIRLPSAIVLQTYPINQYLGNMSPTTSPANSFPKILKMLGAAKKEKKIMPPIQITSDIRCKNWTQDRSIKRASQVNNQ